MNDGKNNDVKTPKFAVALDSQEANLDEHSALNIRRRRLIRGAAGIAPVVLTLRSGALAAAASGCVPYIAAGTTNAGGDAPNTPSAASPGNRCVTSPDQGICPSGQIQHGNIQGTVSGTGSPYQCHLDSDNSLMTNTPVAIISATSASSLH